MTLEPNTTASTPRKLALIVGVNEAKESEQAALRFAKASAVRLAEALAAPACGFSIHNEAPLLGPAATAANVRRTTLKLLRTLTAPDDLLVIVFIGHGIPLPGDERDDVLLATADLDIVAAEADSSDCLSTNWLLKHALQYTGPGSVLLLLGCCHAGAVGEQQLRPELQQLARRLSALGLQLGQQHHGRARMRRVLAAVGSQERAHEADGMTEFVRRLIDGLQGAAADPKDGVVTAESLASYVRRRGRHTDSTAPSRSAVWKSTASRGGGPSARRCDCQHAHPAPDTSVRGAGGCGPRAPRSWY